MLAVKCADGTKFSGKGKVEMTTDKGKLTERRVLWS